MNNKINGAPQSHFESERAKMLLTEILAKATYRQVDGSAVIVAVFAGSTEHEFYWSFRAPSEHAPVSAWKLTNWSPRTHGKFYRDWNSFLAAHEQRYRFQRLIKTWTDSRRLAALIQAGLRSSLHTRVDERPAEQLSTRKVDRKMAFGRNPKLVGSWR